MELAAVAFLFQQIKGHTYCMYSSSSLIFLSGYKSTVKAATVSANIVFVGTLAGFRGQSDVGGKKATVYSECR